MKIEKVRHREDVRRFLRGAGDALSGFRYFASRPVEVVGRHRLTVLGWEADVPVAYGHLDPEGGRTWLGLAVAHAWQGAGRGRQMLETLTGWGDAHALQTIDLTVDADNVAARGLYSTAGFRWVEDRARICLYRRVAERASCARNMDSQASVEY